MTREARSTDPIVRDLHSAFALPTAAISEQLQQRLAERAGREGLLDVAYRTVDSPVGRLLLAATPAGLVRVAFDCENHDDVLSNLADEISPRILRAPARLDDAAHQLDEFFAGRRRAFALPLDLQLARGFRRTTPRSRGEPGTREPCARPRAPARTIRCRWCCRVIASFAATAASATTGAAPTRRRGCWPWRHEDESSGANFAIDCGSRRGTRLA
jgi:hypothetical protein